MPSCCSQKKKLHRPIHIGTVRWHPPGKPIVIFVILKSHVCHLKVRGVDAILPWSCIYVKIYIYIQTSYAYLHIYIDSHLYFFLSSFIVSTSLFLFSETGHRLTRTQLLRLRMICKRRICSCAGVVGAMELRKIVPNKRGSWGKPLVRFFVWQSDVWVFFVWSFLWLIIDYQWIFLVFEILVDLLKLYLFLSLGMTSK